MPLFIKQGHARKEVDNASERADHVVYALVLTRFTVVVIVTATISIGRITPIVLATNGIGDVLLRSSNKTKAS